MSASGTFVSKTDAVLKGSPYPLSLSGPNDANGNGISAEYTWVVTLKAVENDLWISYYSTFSPPSFGTAGINDTNIYEPGSGVVNAYVLKQGETQTFRLNSRGGDFLQLATGNTTTNTQSIYSYFATAELAGAM